MQSIQHEGLYQGQILTNRYQESSLFPIYSFEPIKPLAFNPYLSLSYVLQKFPPPFFFSKYKSLVWRLILTSITSMSLLNFLMCNVGLFYCIFTILQFSKNKDDVCFSAWLCCLILITERYTRLMTPLRYSYCIPLWIFIEHFSNISHCLGSPLVSLKTNFLCL